MRICLSCRGQNVIEYILLVTAVMVVLITGVMSKDFAGKFIFGNKVEASIGVTERFLNARDANMEFRTYDGGGNPVSISRVTATGHL